MKMILMAISSLLVMLPIVQSESESAPPAITKYGKLRFSAKAIAGIDWTALDKGWKGRVELEFEIINEANFPSLRAALLDKNPLVRSMAARALGILSDRKSATALAKLVKSDPSYLVRIRAVESLGFLKMHSAVIELAKRDKQGGVRWSARLAADQLKSKYDYAAQVRRAFAGGIKRAAMGVAKVGRRAPDFTARTMDDKPFKLSSVLGTKPIAIYFAAFDA